MLGKNCPIWASDQFSPKDALRGRERARVDENSPAVLSKSARDVWEKAEKETDSEKRNVKIPIFIVLVIYSYPPWNSIQYCEENFKRKKRFFHGNIASIDGAGRGFNRHIPPEGIVNFFHGRGSISRWKIPRRLLRVVVFCLGADKAEIRRQ